MAAVVHYSIKLSFWYTDASCYHAKGDDEEYSNESVAYGSGSKARATKPCVILSFHPVICHLNFIF